MTDVAGFESNAQFTAMLFPGLPQNQPLAIGFAYEPSEQIDPTALLQTLREAVDRCFEEQAASAVVQPLFDSADRLPVAGMAM